MKTQFCLRSGLLLFSIGLAHATLITQSSDIPSPPTVIDFSDYAGPSVPTDGPAQVGNLVGVDVTFTSNNPDGSFLGSGPFGLGDNGSWDSSVTLAGIDFDATLNDLYTMTFTFNSGPVSAVGGFMNYAVAPPLIFGDVIIAALAADSSVLEQWDITQLAPISTPNGLNDGAFRGIVRPTADIFGFSVSNSAAVLTNLTFSSAEVPAPSGVPEPSTMVLMLSAFVLLAARKIWTARS